MEIQIKSAILIIKDKNWDYYLFNSIKNKLVFYFKKITILIKQYNITYYNSNYNSYNSNNNNEKPY